MLTRLGPSLPARSRPPVRFESFRRFLAELLRTLASQSRVQYRIIRQVLQFRPKMDLLRKAVQNELRQRCRPTKQEQVIDIIGPRSAEESWRRLTLRIHMLLASAKWVAALQELKQIMPKRCKPLEPIPMETEDGVKNLRIMRTKAQVLARPQLSRSKSLRVDLDPEGLCQHKRLIRRGGKTFWWACATCPCRWPREQGEFLIDD